MKKQVGTIVLLLLGAVLLMGYTDYKTAATRAVFDKTGAITVVAREDGSGTRAAFIDLFNIEIKEEGGVRKDLTTKEAIVAKQTDTLMQNISLNQYAIGYMSLGSLNEMLKPIRINSVYPTAANVLNGSYPIARPFILATKGLADGITKDFMNFILSQQGQEVVARYYVPVKGDSYEYAGGGLQGKIVIAGSSSVTPIMEKLKEAYAQLNPDVVIEIQMSDSTAGMMAANNGICQIAMSSRELAPNELAGLVPVEIARDGIAVVVNENNPIQNLTAGQVQSIFMGAITHWESIIHE